MLSSARQGARIAPRLAFSFPAFAESSRQAELRAAAPTVARRYSAAAFARAAEPHDDAHGQDFPLDAPKNSGAPLDTRQRPPYPPHDGHKLTPAERFRRQLQYDPTGALLSLRGLSPAALKTISAKDLKTMIYHATTQIQPSRQVSVQVDHDDVTKSLQIVRALLHAQPSENARKRDGYMGRTIKGRTLRGLLRLGVLYGAHEFVAELFAERMSEQIALGTKIVDTDGLAVDLAAAREWQLATDLFPGPEPAVPRGKYVPPIGALPRDVYTPQVVAIMMTANLCTHQPWRAIKLFPLLSPDRNVRPEAHCALIQAYLQLGEVAAAKQAVHNANEAGVSTDAIQLAMLRGHRMLGFDAELEGRVREDLARLGIPPHPRLLAAFIWLCIDGGNLDAADALLTELEACDATSDSMSSETVFIGLAVASQRNDVGRTRRTWSRLDDELVTDNAVSHLCRALGRLGQPEDAFGVLKAAVLHDHGSSPWRLPESFVPGVLTANAVLQCACRGRSYGDLLSVLNLMRAGGIEPDNRTVIEVLEFANRTLVSSPQSLAKLLQAILGSTHNTPTVDQINIILGEVVRIAARNPTVAAAQLEPDAGATKDPTGGIQLRGELRALLAKQIAALRLAGQQSTGRTLSNRLLYDALALDGVWPVQAVQKTWQSFVLRGFRPSPQHYLTLLVAYARIGAMREAEETLILANSDAAGVEGRRPNAKLVRNMLTALITGWARAGDLAAARTAYDRVRSLPSGPDATALAAIVSAHAAAGQPDRAVALARRDMPVVEPTERLVAAVAHALRKSGDMPGCVFFLSHFTLRNGPSNAGGGGGGDAPGSVAVFDSPADPAPDAQWTLTPRLLSVLRKAVNYLSKQPVSDERAREAILLATRMLDDDRATRPPMTRKRPALTRATRRQLADAVDIHRADRVPPNVLKAANAANNHTDKHGL